MKDAWNQPNNDVLQRFSACVATPEKDAELRAEQAYLEGVILARMAGLKPPFQEGARVDAKTETAVIVSRKMKNGGKVRLFTLGQEPSSISSPYHDIRLTGEPLTVETVHYYCSGSFFLEIKVGVHSSALFPATCFVATEENEACATARRLFVSISHGTDISSVDSYWLRRHIAYCADCATIFEGLVAHAE